MASLADFKTADTCFRGEDYFDSAIKCQQCIEKLTKGIYGLYYGFACIPRTHDITRILISIIKILKDDEDKAIPDDYIPFFDQLTGYYIGNRYPTALSDLFFFLDQNETEWVLDKTKEVFDWLLTLKP
jgi:HEPN domain-containing protein